MAAQITVEVTEDGVTSRAVWTVSDVDVAAMRRQMTRDGEDDQPIAVFLQGALEFMFDNWLQDEA